MTAKGERVDERRPVTCVSIYMSPHGVVIVLRRIAVLVAASLIAVAAVASSAPRRQLRTGTPLAVAAALAKPEGDTTQWIEMRDVDLRIGDDEAIRVAQLRGQVRPTTSGTIAMLDDPGSYRIRVTSGSVALTGPDLAALLNDYVFAYKGSPLRDIKARTEGTELVLSGIMHKGVDLPFEMTSTLSLDPDGRIRSHPTRMKILGVNGTALLHAFGLRLDKVLDVSGSRGASVQGDDLLLEPTRIIPPPTIEGRLASIRVEGDRVVQTFVRTPDDSAAAARFTPDSAAHHYIYFRGGQLRFGKLTMHDTDLLIVDANQRDPFDLYMAKYNDQLVAGYSKNLPNYGLRVSMPDYASVRARTPTVARRSE
jgi:hypothetical protein